VRSPWRETPRRRASWFALIAAVAVAHALFGLEVAASVIGWQGSPEPRRIEVALVRQLEPTAPPAVPPAAGATAATEPAAPHPHAVHRHAPSASEAAAQAAKAEHEAASAAAQRDELKARALALAAALEASSASAPAGAASRAVAAASPPETGASAAVASPFQPALEWPPSTRLTYTLTGLYRNGPLYGQAQVDWRRDGLRYQVEFNFSVSPMFDERMFSDGRIGDEGLVPRHYEEMRKVPLVAPRFRVLEFGEDEVVLANGTHVPRLPQTQDPASQFVQFVWMFTVHPEWLKPGNVVEIPLALPNTLRRWQYEVGQLESLQLPFGSIDAVHLKPVIVNRRPNEYPFEIWTAPTLQYLPIKIRVLLDEQNFAELTLDSKPLQALPRNDLP
jgi:hypothetical protein